VLLIKGKIKLSKIPIRISLMQEKIFFKLFLKVISKLKSSIINLNKIKNKTPTLFIFTKPLFILGKLNISKFKFLNRNSSEMKV
jgi:hypothetical protein